MPDFLMQNPEANEHCGINIPCCFSHIFPSKSKNPNLKEKPRFGRGKLRSYFELGENMANVYDRQCKEIQGAQSTISCANKTFEQNSYKTTLSGFSPRIKLWNLVPPPSSSYSPISKEWKSKKPQSKSGLCEGKIRIFTHLKMSLAINACVHFMSKRPV